MSERKGTKGRIEAAALQLFVDKGVSATSIRDIAAAVGFSDGALYRHYASKDELVWSLFRDSFASYAGTLADLAAGCAGTRAKIAAMVHGFCDLFDADSR